VITVPLATVIERCHAELAARPSDPRLSFLLANALTAGRRYAEAKPHLETALKAGYAMAFVLEAQAYLTGAGRSRDVAKAADSYRHAMERGVALAAYELGLIKWHAIGVPRDTAGAIALWRRAAEADNPHAHAVLGKLGLAMWGQPAEKAELLFRFALAYRLFADAGQAASAVNARISQANLAQYLGVNELSTVLNRLAAWTPSPQTGRLRP
jgi:TPR repeat protein